MLSKIIFGGLLVLLVIAPIPYGTVEPWWKAAFVCGVLGIFILAICDTAIRNSIRLNPFSVLLPLFALTGFAFFQSWTGISADLFQTRFFALQLVALTAFLALLYRYAATEKRLRILVYTVICIAVVSAIFGILRQTAQQQIGFVLPLLKPNQGFGQFINKNHFAYLMEMAFGLGIGLIAIERAKQNRLILHVALLLPIWVALVLSNSRGGILAMLIQIVVAALLLLKLRAEGFHSKQLVVVRAALVVALVAGVLVGTLWIGGDRLVSSIEAASDMSANTTLEREGASRNDIWRASAKLFAAHPVFGAGLGAYWARISAHHDASGVLVPQEAHNDYLELLASGGVLGLVLGVWFVVNVFREARRNLWTSTGFIRAARIGAIVGLAGVAVHSLFDFGLHLFGNAVVFMTLIMIATAQLEEKKSLIQTNNNSRLAH